MKETKKFDRWIGILSISVITIVAIVFISMTSNVHLAKGTYATGITGYCNCNNPTKSVASYTGDCSDFSSLTCTSGWVYVPNASSTDPSSSSKSSSAAKQVCCCNMTNGGNCGWYSNGCPGMPMGIADSSECAGTANPSSSSKPSSSSSSTATRQCCCRTDSGDCDWYNTGCPGSPYVATADTSKCNTNTSQRKCCCRTDSGDCDWYDNGCPGSPYVATADTSKCNVTLPSSSYKIVTIYFYNAEGKKALGSCSTGPTTGKLVSSTCSGISYGGTCTGWSTTYCPNHVCDSNNTQTQAYTWASLAATKLTSNLTLYCKAGTSIHSSTSSTSSNNDGGSSNNNGGGTSNNNGGGTSNNNGGGGTNASSNPQTGTAVIIFAWVIGLFAIGYSFWYFKRTSKI